jgi:hypothetical protein
MPESLSNSRVTSDKQILFINREKICGAQSIQASIPTTASPLHFANIYTSRTSFIPVGEQVGDVSIDAILINKDYFLRYVTGNHLVNGYVLKAQNNSTDNYSFLSGYFTRYTCQYSDSQPTPQITTNIRVINNLGKIATGSFATHQIQDLNFISTGNFTNNSPLIPHIGSISLGIDDFNSNRVSAFNISVNTNKVPVYNMGSRSPKRVDLIYPIEVQCSFTFELGDYTIPFMRNYPSSAPKQIENLNLQVNDYSNGSGIITYSFQNLILTNTTYGTSVDGNVIINTVFEGHINRSGVL